MIIEISVGVVSAAIVILTITFIFTLRNVNRTLFQLRQTANALETDTHQVLINTNGLITETRTMVTHVKTKTEHTDALFQAIDQIGKQINEVSACVSKATEQHKEKLGGLLAIVGAAINLVQEWRQNNQKGRMNDG